MDSYEVMLMCEKNGARSRMLSICFIDFNSGWRSPRSVSASDNENSEGRCYENCEKETRIVENPIYLRFNGWYVTDDISKLIHQRLREPIVRFIHSVDGVGHEDPLMAVRS